jgi:hypothetical protein
MTAPRLNAGLHREVSDCLSHTMAQQHLDQLNEINLNVHWLEMISNEELWRRTEETKVSTQIKRRKWNWIGCTLRKGNETNEQEALDWNPQGKRRRGGPRHTWRRSVHNEALENGKSWSEAKRMARNRTRWRCFADSLCPLRDNRN